MVKRRIVAVNFLSLVAALIVSGCGQEASATPTPVLAGSTPAQAATEDPAGSVRPVPAATAPQAPAYSGTVYTVAQAKEYLSQNFLLPGMQMGAGETPRRGGVATFSNRGDLEGADPMVYTGISNDNILSSVTGESSLVRPKASNVFEPEPWIAESWASEQDFMVWTFQIRKDVKWHDGVQLKADDVKFWLDLAIFPPKGRRSAVGLAQNFGSVKDIQVVDEYAVRLTLKEPAPFLLETAFRYGNVMAHPKHLAEPLIEKGNVTVNMTDLGWVSVGPFKFDRYNKGSSFRVVKNDLYFEKDSAGRALPYLDAIYYPIIPDSTVAVSAFRAGRIDGTSRGTGHNLSPDNVKTIKSSLGARAWFARFPYLAWGAGMNVAKPPFDDVRLRRALTMYTDRPQQIELIYGGFGIQAGAMQVGSFWGNPNFRTWPGYRPDKAKDQADARELLKESGLEGVTINVACRDFYLLNCEFLELTLRGLGANPKLEVMDQLRIQGLTQSGNYSIQISGVSPDLPNDLLLTYISTNPSDFTFAKDPKLDGYHRMITSTIDQAERRKVLWAAEYYLLVDKAYTQPWSREEAVVGFRTYVKGVWVPGTQAHNLNDHRSTWLDPALK